MKKRKKNSYKEERIGKVKIIPDFLPPPNKLVPKEEAVKITLVLSKTSVDFFKHLAEENHTHYQKMIRTLLDKYAAFYSQ